MLTNAYPRLTNGTLLQRPPAGSVAASDQNSRLRIVSPRAGALQFTQRSGKIASSRMTRNGPLASTAGFESDAVTIGFVRMWMPPLHRDDTLSHGCRRTQSASPLW